jgi:hypothetical protein
MIDIMIPTTIVMLGPSTWRSLQSRGLIPFVEYVLVRQQEPRMSTIHLHQTTSLTPEQYIAGLTDFGPGRSKLFGNSADEYLKVHRKGATEADVTEGSGGIWERLHYDWSDPHRVILKTTDSNLWGGASGHTYTFTRHPNGTTDIDVVIVRDGKNLRGWLLGLVVGTIGKGVLEKAFKNSVKAIELRNSRASQPQ